MKNFYSRFGAVAALLSLTSMIAVPAFAVTDTSHSASVTIEQGLSFSGTQDPDFGTVGSPSGSSTNTFTLAPTGDSDTIGGSGDGKYISGAKSGAFTVNGAASQSVTVTALIGTFSGSGVTVTNTKLKLGSATLVTSSAGDAAASDSGSLSAGGSLTVGVGGAISIAGATAAGAQTATLTLTAAYD